MAWTIARQIAFHLRVPFTLILEAIDQLEAGELRLLVQRLEDRLAAVQSWRSLTQDQIRAEVFFTPCKGPLALVHARPDRGDAA
jgi:hypothetical protein